MFYFSAFIAIVGAIGYQFFIRRVPQTLNPVVNVVAIYIAVLTMSLVLLPLFPPQDGIMQHVKQLSWIQIEVAVFVFFIELGFLLMYRYGWNLSTANLITGVIINIALLGLGMFFLHEKINYVNVIGIILSIIGVALIGYR